MKGKLLRGISGSVQPRRLLHGYQDAVFAWSGENPFANLAQSNLYRILPRTQYSDNWLKSTPYGKAFRANNYSGSGHGYVFSRHVPDANQTYAKGVTGYAEFVYSANLQTGEFIQHLCCISSSADGNTGDTYYGVLTLGLEVFSGKGLCPIFRAGNNTTLYGFAGGSSDFGGGTLVPVSIPVGAKVRQMVTFDPVSKEYASILAFNDSVYEASGTVPNGFASTGSTILIGGYPRSGVRAAYVSGMMEAAIWNRTMAPAEMYALLQRPSIFQPAEFIFPFSFGESSGSEVINATPEAIALSPAQATILATEALNTSVESLNLTPVSASILEAVTVLATPATIALSGVKASISASEAIHAKPATIGLTGVHASVRLSEAIHTKPDTIALTGVTSSISMTGAIEIQANPAIISLSGVNASINLSGQIQIDAKVATATLVASKATFAQHAVVTTQPDALVLNPVTAGIYAGEAVVDAAAQALTLSGVNAGIVLDSGSVNFGTTNTSRYFLSDAMTGMDLSGDFSIVAVISPDYTVSNHHKYFFSTAVSSSDPAGLNLYITSNNGFLSLLTSGASAVSSAAVPPGWCLVYARRIAGVVSVGFVDLSNGTHTKSNASSTSANFSNDVAVIGGRLDLDATRFFTGGMSWIALLETGLSDGQIESIAAGTTGLLNDFEPSVVELWDMTFNRSIQPGVVHGINAQRFGDGWGAGGDNPLPYEIEEAEIISTIPATIGLTGVHASVNVSGSVTISAIPAVIGLHGDLADLNITNILATSTAHASLYGAYAGLYSTEILSGKPASIILQGNQALIPSDGVVNTWPDSIGIFGQKADISMRTMLAANPASMILASMRAQITYESPVVWGSMTIEARLQDMTIEARLQGMTIEARQ